MPDLPAAVRRAGLHRHVREAPRRSRLALRKIQGRPARLTVDTVDARDLGGRNDVFVMVAPSEDDEGGESTDAAEHDHPPDVPDQRETHDGCKEGAHKT